MSRLVDISPPITERIGVWPGDVPYSRTITCAIDDGSNIDLSAIRTTVHLGAHTDAPSHYLRGGAHIAARPLDLYYGPCQVVAVEVGRGARILPDRVTTPIVAPRVLLRTGTFPDPDTFGTDFASLSPELVHWLHARGVRLVGIDTPSIDPFDDAELLSHAAVAEHDMAVLEGIVLSEVAPGRYTLVALPLPLVGADASPVRAALVVGDD